MQALSPRVPLLPLPQLGSSRTGPSEAHPTTFTPVEPSAPHVCGCSSSGAGPWSPSVGTRSCPVAIPTALSLQATVTLTVCEQNRGGPSRLRGLCQPPFLASGMVQVQDGPPPLPWA